MRRLSGLGSVIFVFLFAVLGFGQSITVNTPIHTQNKFDPTQPMQTWQCSNSMVTLGTPMLIFYQANGAPGSTVDCNGNIVSGSSGPTLSISGVVAASCGSGVGIGELVAYIPSEGGYCEFPGANEQVMGVAATAGNAGATITINVIGQSMVKVSSTANVNRGAYLIPDPNMGLGYLATTSGSYSLNASNSQQRIVGKALAAASAGSTVAVMLFGPGKYGTGVLAGAWGNFSAQTADATIDTVGFNTSFLTPDGASSWSWQNLTAATSSVPQFSIPLSLLGQAWTGTASQASGWSLQSTSDFPSKQSRFVIQRAAGGFVGETSYVQMPAIGLVEAGLAALGLASDSTGLQFTILDSTTVAVEGQTCVGGSNNVAIAFSDGTNWKCF